jgi:hypothetical protein
VLKKGIAHLDGFQTLLTYMAFPKDRKDVFEIHALPKPACKLIRIFTPSLEP